MIRKRKAIEVQLRDTKKQLDNVIKGTLDRERADDETVKMIEKGIADLRSEIRFEDTLEGKIELFEKTAFHRISTILKELSDVTGKNYLLKPTAFDPNFDYSLGEAMRKFKGGLP